MKDRDLIKYFFIDELMYKDVVPLEVWIKNIKDTMDIKYTDKGVRLRFKYESYGSGTIRLANLHREFIHSKLNVNAIIYSIRLDKGYNEILSVFIPNIYNDKDLLALTGLLRIKGKLNYLNDIYSHAPYTQMKEVILDKTKRARKAL